MTKEEFLQALRQSLAALPEEEREERLAFLAEAIDDRMEEGMTESEAVALCGSVEEITESVAAEMPLTALVKRAAAPKRHRSAGMILLLVLGSPVWLPVLAAVFALALTLYLVLWVLVLAVWIIEVAVAACALSGVIMAVYYAVQKNLPGAGIMLGAALVAAGLALLLFPAACALTRGLAKGTKSAVLNLKKRILRKEAKA